jgi:undecaprenyl diphosphate synthase
MNALVHLGIIMDGNRRWATQRGLPAPLGHRAGIAAVRKTVEAVRKHEVPYLTLYAFSSDNWQRSSKEVRSIFGLLDAYLMSELDLLVEHHVRVQVIGRRDRLPKRTLRLIRLAEERTAGGDALLLRLAVDYSSRDALVATAQALASRFGANATLDRAAFSDEMHRQIHSPAVPDIDLVIRTSGVSSGFRTSACGSAPTRSSGSHRRCGPTSTKRRSHTRSTTTPRGSADSARRGHDTHRARSNAARPDA